MDFKNNKYLKYVLEHPWVKYGLGYAKGAYDKTIETNSQLKTQFLQFIPFLIASLITGILAYIYSYLFSKAEHLSALLFEKENYSIFISAPLSFLISWFLVRKYSPYSQGSGIPQVMAAMEVQKSTEKKFIKRLLNVKVILVKILASIVKVIGGGVIGREGPTIQIAASVFNQVYRKLPKWWIPVSQKNILIAGAASGLAAAFNTPLGGIIFAIEEMSKYHINRYKAPLFVAVIIAGLTAQGLGGSYLYLGYPHTKFSGALVYLGIVIVAIVTGIFGSLMTRILLRFMRFVNTQKTNLRQIPIVILSGLFVAGFAYWLGEDAMGSGKELMERLLFQPNKTVDWYLPFVRMNALIASFGSGGAGGIFAPSLSAGATFGAVIAEFMGLMGDNANILILIGMTGFLTSVTRAPFTASIIIFEMTDRHSIIFYLLLGSVIANIFATFVEKRSFYDILKESYLTDLREKSKPKEIL